MSQIERYICCNCKNIVRGVFTMEVILERGKMCQRCSNLTKKDLANFQSVKVEIAEKIEKRKNRTYRRPILKRNMEEDFNQLKRLSPSIIKEMMICGI